MKGSILLPLIAVALLFPECYYMQDSDIGTTNILPQELEPAIGHWNGNLTYIDYSSGEPYTMPAELKVTQGRSLREFSLYYLYPNEPKANNKDKLKLSKNGDHLNGDKVISRSFIENGVLEVMTSHLGKDNRKKATIRNIYTVGKSILVIRKEVQYLGSDEWLKRNEYSFKRTPE